MSEKSHIEMVSHFVEVSIQGGHWPRKGYGDVRPWRPPFHASPAARKGPISSKRVSSQDPLLRKFGNFSLYSLNFHPNFSSQASKFGNFQLTSPQIWKFSAHKPPNLEIFRSQAPLFRGKCQFASPTLRKSGPHTPTWKKVECPPPRGLNVTIGLPVCGKHLLHWNEVTALWKKKKQKQNKTFLTNITLIRSSGSFSWSLGWANKLYYYYYTVKNIPHRTFIGMVTLCCEAYCEKWVDYIIENKLKNQ